MNSNRVFKKSDKVVDREFEEETILFPLYASSKDTKYIYTLNGTASYAWKLIDGKRTLGQIQDNLMKAFGIGEKKISRQLQELFKDLRKIKAIL